MVKTPRFRVALLTVLLGTAATTCGSNAPSNASAPPAQGAAAPPQPGAAEEPRCVMSCSREQPRTVVAEISWPLAQSAASREALSQGVSSQTLEVTTFKEGFERGLFAEVGTVREQQPFAARAAQPDVTVGAALRGLTVTRVDTLGDRLASGASRSADDLMPASAGGDASRVVVVEVQGLSSGLTYWWRRGPGAPAVRCQAPVCPYDNGRR